MLRTARQLTGRGVQADLYERVAQLPHFNPDEDADPLHEEVAGLRDAIHRASALVLSTPEYAGALPGAFKNLLDWTIGDDRPGSIYQKPVAWINASPRGALSAHEELARVLGYAHAAVVESACAGVPVTAAMIDEDGLIADLSVRHDIARAITILADQARCLRDDEKVSERGSDQPVPA